MKAPAGRKSRAWVAGLLVAILTVIVYLPALENDFVSYDDHKYVYENAKIRNLDLPFLRWAFTTLYFGNWHPLTWISYAVDSELWGLNPLGFHLTNVLFHGINTFLVVLLSAVLLRGAEQGKRSGESFILIAAGATGILFGLHPIHVESVAWISERKDVLCGFFFLLSVLSYLRHAAGGQEERTHLPYVLSILFFALALMSKPMAVTLPLILIILDVVPLQRLNLRKPIGEQFNVFIEKLPFIGLSVASSLITVIAQRSAMSPLEVYPLWMRIIVGMHSILFYLAKMIWPSPLVALYPYPSRSSVLSGEYIGAALLVAMVTVLVILPAKRQKLWAAVWFSFIIMLLPVLGFIKVGHQAAADRYTYLPSLAAFLLGGIGISLLGQRLSAKVRNTVAAVAGRSVPIVLMAALLSAGTVRQTAIWKDSLTLWNHQLMYYPDSYVGYASRAAAYLNLNDFARAVDDAGKAIQLFPLYATAYQTRSKAYLMLSRYGEALSDAERAVELAPENKTAYFDRRLALQAAIKHYGNAIMQRPDDPALYVNRGIYAAMLGDTGGAVADFTKALSLDRQLSAAYFNRGLAYEAAGNAGAAVKDFQQAARLGDAEARSRLQAKGIPW